MKKIDVFVFAIIFTLTIFFKVNAQSAETIWLSTAATTYKTGETVVVTVNTTSHASVQGLKFQARYDPVCLRLLSATSPILEMKSSPLSQTPGVVDADFISATPQTVDRVFAEVKFLTLSECQTNLTLVSAALMISDEAGSVAPLTGVVLDGQAIQLNIEKELRSDSVTPSSSGRELPSWLLVIFSLLAVAFGLLITINLLRGSALN